MEQVVEGPDLDDPEEGGTSTRRAVGAKYLFLYLHGIESSGHLFEPGQEVQVKIQYGSKETGPM